MSGRKKCLATVLILLILAAAAAGILWHRQHYCIVDFKMYARDAELLDLRDQEISVDHYTHIRQVLPESRILWNVPFQDNRYSESIQSLKVTTLKETDLDVIACFRDLKTVDAKGCTDYAQLLQLQEQYPHLEVEYTVTVSGQDYGSEADTIFVKQITEEELESLAYLRSLSQVCIESDDTPDTLKKLIEYCQDRNITVSIGLNGTYHPVTADKLTLSGAGEKEIALLSWFPELEQVHLTDPQTTADTLLLLQAERPEVLVTWEKELLGATYTSDTEVLDLTDVIFPESTELLARAANAPIHGERDEELHLFAIPDRVYLPDRTAETETLIAQLKEALPFFPKLEKVLLCGGLLDNDAMAAFREEYREDCQVIWTVQCGEMAVRTDSPYFMPTKYHVYYFHDEDAANLRYCQDMISVDLGHMSVRNIEWVESMPNLTYLVLAHSDIRSLEPLRNCKKLKFLELDWSAVQDYSPLTDCTGLEDLNLGNTGREIDPICQMSWLKNLWMVGCPGYSVVRATQALPNTTVMGSGSATVGSGWRKLQNYCDMRDVMNMYYMS